MEEMVELPERHKEILAKNLPLLEKIGFDIEPFGHNAFVVRAVPSVFDGEFASSVLKTFLEQK
jgi:DNA mismatch repair ATPase MutL